MSYYNKSLPVDGSEHKALLDGIRNRKKAAEAKIDTTRVQRAEELFRVYVEPTEKRNEARSRTNKGDRDYEEIVVPYATAILLTAHTYWTSVFLSRDPVMQFMGLNGEGENNILALEALINYQINVGGMMPVFYNWLLDTGKYGRGIVGLHWDKELFPVAEYVEEDEIVGGLPVIGKKVIKLQRKIVEGYCGNKLYNVRPTNFLCDSRVSFSDLQKGEYCGEKTKVSHTFLRKKGLSREFINVKEALRSGSQWGDTDDSGAPGQDFPEDANFWEDDKSGFFDMTTFIWELVPNDWGLDDSQIPEKWVFRVVNDKVIVQARPLGCLHNKFPYCVMEYECDPYSLGNRGLLEMLEPLNKIMTWLFNSHMFSVRTIQNGMYVIDPTKIVEGDIRKRTNGEMRVVRLTPTSWGTDVRTAFAQIETRDVTANHIKDSQAVAEMMQRLSGVSDNIMGMLAPGGRKTATEVRTSSSMGANRLKTNSEYFSAGGFTPLARMMVMNSQQYYDDQRKMLIAGDRGQGEQYVDVSPELIAGEYLYTPVDGTLPVDRYAQAALWKEMIAVGAKVPQIMQGYDVAGIFGWIAQLAGMKNINRFKIAVQPPGAMPPPGMEGMPVSGMPSGGNGRDIPVGSAGAGPVA